MERHLGLQFTRLSMEEAALGAVFPGDSTPVLMLRADCSLFGSGSLLVIQAACYSYIKRSFYMKRSVSVEGLVKMEVKQVLSELRSQKSVQGAWNAYLSLVEL